MAPNKLSPAEQQHVIEAFKRGATQAELMDRYNCHRRTIGRILVAAGLGKVFKLWDPAHVDELTDLVKTKKHSAGQIALLLNKKFDTAYSRGSVIGKMHRLGLTEPVKAVPKPKRVVAKRSTPFIAPPQLKAVPFEELVDNNDAINVTMLGLEDGMCKWPTGDATYCGHDTGGRRVTYCRKHRNAGTQPAKYRGVWGVRT